MHPMTDGDTEGRGTWVFSGKSSGAGICAVLLPTGEVLCPTPRCGSRSQGGDIYLEHSRINDEKFCLRDKMMKGKSDPASSALRVQG